MRDWDRDDWLYAAKALGAILLIVLVMGVAGAEDRRGEELSQEAANARAR